MQMPATLAANASVYRYTFDGSSRNVMLYALLEQANKAKHTSRLDKEPRVGHLSLGEKARMANMHVKNYVVLLPVTLPATVVDCPASVVDTAKCAMLTQAIVGNLVLIDYQDGDDCVLFATGVIADRAYVNNGDGDTRVTVYGDDPDKGEDKQPLVLPVHILDVFQSFVTWRDIITATCKYDMGDWASVVCACLLDPALPDLQRKLSPELTVFTAGGATPALDADVMWCRVQAVAYIAGMLFGGETKRVVDHLAHSPTETLVMCPTMRCWASDASLQTVLTAAAAAARKRLSA
jgi:hypothetical protein